VASLAIWLLAGHQVAVGELGAIISSMASRSALAVASKKRRARALLFSCSDDTAASSSFFFMSPGVHLPRDGNIYDATRGGQTHCPEAYSPECVE
jgi:hypothetical protein